ncbi:chromosome partitioning protein ParB [Phyllobacterium sp. SYP-B3895]|uniref:plasmid partitioning protein RepB C-terminal domain-containing protein n=1 Tax=Phyllobacterium sp. SYP-B3895 TaxID=2663240 RepID=UPI0012995612|nr:plasmid partitioning protein RepB C-terminal domain-containing protein [Phyllobacterium sp. SYP-B3895]MRG54194.1 chromosome partitioning protein ParB [Phyllobacterium sp. SYP-B3895]
MIKDALIASWKDIEVIPIAQIRILNPRFRDKRKFQQIVESISKVGLKRPITVARGLANESSEYDLVCGQGRIEAYKELGETHIPAIIVEASLHERLIMSLVENCARRQHRTIDLLQDVLKLRDIGYSDREIADKIGVTPEYIGMIVGLLEKGEDRLLTAVEVGVLPLSLAVEIARVDEDGAQTALIEAYTKNKIRGKKLVALRRLLQTRNRRGGQLRGHAFGRYERQRPITSEAIVRAYQLEASRQKVLVKKAEVTQGKLLFVVEALRTLLADNRFLELLKSEGLDAVPSQLNNRLLKG